MFLRKDSTLTSINYVISSENEIDKDEVNTMCENFYNESSNRFGKPITDFSIPFVGKMITWEIKRTKILLTQLNVKGIDAIMVDYSQKK